MKSVELFDPERDPWANGLRERAHRELDLYLLGVAMGLAVRLKREERRENKG